MVMRAEAREGTGEQTQTQMCSSPSAAAATRVRAVLTFFARQRRRRSSHLQVVFACRCDVHRRHTPRLLRACVRHALVGVGQLSAQCGGGLSPFLRAAPPLAQAHVHAVVPVHAGGRAALAGAWARQAIGQPVHDECCNRSIPTTNDIRPERHQTDKRVDRWRDAIDGYDL